MSVDTGAEGTRTWQDWDVSGKDIQGEYIQGICNSDGFLQIPLQFRPVAPRLNQGSLGKHTGQKVPATADVEGVKRARTGNWGSVTSSGGLHTPKKRLWPQTCVRGEECDHDIWVSCSSKAVLD